MKSTIFWLSLSVCMFTNCSPDEENTTEPEEPEMTEFVTYTNTIEPLLAGNCLNCHGATPTNGAPSSLHTYDLAKSQADLIRTRINSTSAPMPPSGSLSVTDRNLVDQWIADGLME